MRTNQIDSVSGPNQTRYYSEQDQGVYYLYRYIETGVLTGYLGKPWGLDALNGSAYGIPGPAITEAAARAYLYAGFNYTQQDVNDRITASLSSNGALTPFEDGPAWEGTWSLPVCDTGDMDWNSQYGQRKNGQYGMLPCCCGALHDLL